MFKEVNVKKIYNQEKNDFEDITSNYQNTPEFIPLSQAKAEKKSLNDKLKNNGLKVGLNDKIAFIKHLFDGNADDFNRVLSQINTATSFDEASGLLQNMVKPDYNNWEGKEDYEARLIQLLEIRFDV